MSLQLEVHSQGESAQQSTLNQNIARQMIWRRNAPYFYQLLYTNEVEWPALSVQWWIAEESLAGKCRTNKDDDDTTCYIAMGTQTSGEQQNYLQLAKVYIPNQDYIRKINKDKPLKTSETIRKNDNAMEDKLKIEYEIEHEGQVNKIKHHPKKTNLIATRTPLGEIHVFDKSKCKYGKNKLSPAFILAGHETEGYAIEWNPNNDAYMIGGSYDGRLSLWDANNKEDSGNKKILPLCDFNFHEKEIEDVSFSPFHQSILSSCDDDGWLVLWDTRNNKGGPIYKLKGHEGVAYSMQFSPLGQYMFASGGQDKTVKVWDIRNLSENLFRCSSPNLDTITQLKWAPDDKSALWTVSNNLLTLWNIAEQEAKFIHAGHMKNILQMDIHPFQTETIVSTDQNNEVHIFQPNRNCKL